VGVVLRFSYLSDPGQTLVAEVEKQFRLVEKKETFGITVMIFDKRR
jgi:hypothetical protein